MTGSGPGRPQIGPAFVVRFPVDLIARVDQAAAEARTSRAGWLRDAAEEQLRYPRSDLSALAAWMVDEGLSSDVGYALEKPWKYEAELYCATHEVGLADLDDLQHQRNLLSGNDLARGWTHEQISPVDFVLRCTHETVLRDTQAERAGRTPTRCARGCTPPAGLDVHVKAPA